MWNVGFVWSLFIEYHSYRAGTGWNTGYRLPYKSTAREDPLLGGFLKRNETLRREWTVRSYRESLPPQPS